MIRTGEQYRDGLRDDREVWIDGAQVRDITTHPAFKTIVDAKSACTTSRMSNAFDFNSSLDFVGKVANLPEKANQSEQRHPEDVLAYSFKASLVFL
jgi:hypothetical protein